ncbi:MAG: ABC transporter permease [Propionibacteriaceae bacterium]|nr:ABC transporter permease [Propionibacteriaceae bacterium]
MNSIRAVFADLRVHPGRNTLTALSLFVGVLAVMAIIVTGDVVKEVFVAKVEQRGGRYQTFERQASVPMTVSHQDLASVLTDLPARDGASVGCLVHPETHVDIALGPQSHTGASQGTTTAMEVFFVCGDYREIYRLPLSQGYWLTPDATSPYEVVANNAAAGYLGGPGTTVWLYSSTTDTAFPATIVGIVNDGATGPRLFTNAMAWLVNTPQLFQADSVTLVWQQPGIEKKQVQRITTDWLVDNRLGADGEAFETDTVIENLDIISLVQWSFSAVAALSLIVAALGIINVGLASIKERSRELVIRRALGATKASLVRMIIGSSLVLSIIVASISAGFAWIALIVFRSQLPHDTPINPPAYPVSAAIIGASVSVATALLGSIIPGLRAAKLQPGKVLRD